MNTNADSNDVSTPSSDASVAVVDNNPPKQSRLIKFTSFILIASFIVVITVAVIFFTKNQPQKTSQSKNPVSQTQPINLKSEYQNPFDKNNQYVNPFENLK